MLSRPLELVRLVLVGSSLIAGIAVAMLAGDIFSLFFFVSYALAGSLLVARRPRNVIGWLLIAAGWSFLLASLTVRVSPRELDAGTASLADALIAWGTGWGWPGAVGLMLALAMVFPSGSLPDGRWRLPSATLLLLTALTVVGTAFGPTLSITPAGSTEAIKVANPVALLGALSIWSILSIDELAILLLVALGVGAISLVVRYRRAVGQERFQLRWLVAAIGYVVVALAASLLLFPLVGGLAWIPAAVGFPMIPAAIAAAVLRHRLYEIDILVSRTALYASVTMGLAGVFGLVNLAAQRLLQGITGSSSDVATAALAVGAALSFSPISRRVKPLAERLLPGRAVLAFLFLDIVGSTQKAVEIGDNAWRRLLSDFRASVRAELTRFSGREINTAGDGFFVTFERPSPALQCAEAIRSAVERLGLEVRIGLHLGECEVRGETLSGVEVHVAARVMSEAGAGEILISEAFRDALDPGETRTVDRGRHDLKGLPGTWVLFRVVD